MTEPQRPVPHRERRTPRRRRACHGGRLARDTAAFALGDGAVVLVKDGATHRVAAHPDGAILAAASDGERLVTGGDDGRVAVTGRTARRATLAETGGAWIDALAAAPGRRPSPGAPASASRPATTRAARRPSRRPPPCARPRLRAEGLPAGDEPLQRRDALVPEPRAKPEVLEWKGSHLDVTWSPDGRFVVTSMQENALHGWRLQPDKGHMRMSGYPAKTRSWSWSHDGQWLATSGADAAIVGPSSRRRGRWARRRANAACGRRR